MALAVKDLQQNLIGPGAEALVIDGEVPPNLIRTRCLQAKWHETHWLLGVVTYFTPHEEAEVMSGGQLRSDRRSSAHLAGDGK